MARLVIGVPRADHPRRGSLIEWPDLTVELSERGLAIERASTFDDNADRVGEIVARETSVRVRRYRDGDDAQIRALFERSFHRPLTEAAWRWRYRENPLGGPLATLACADDGTLIGHYGGYPIAVRSGEDLWLRAHHIGDLMTAPDARGLGHAASSILRRMAVHFWAAFGEGRADFHFGFNTGTSRTLQARLVPGVRTVEPVTVWTASLGELFYDASAHPSLRVDRISTFDAEWDAFAARVADDYGVHTARDAAFMNWRYARRPDHESIVLTVRDGGRLAGGAVFAVDGGHLRWGDALFDPRVPAAPAALFHDLRSRAVPRDIRGWFSVRPAWWARRLDALGFQAQRETNGLTLMFAPFTAEAERLVPHLYYSWGDSDLF